jgi:hypothetical protein
LIWIDRESERKTYFITLSVVIRSTRKHRSLCLRRMGSKHTRTETGTREEKREGGGRERLWESTAYLLQLLLQLDNQLVHFLLVALSLHQKLENRMGTPNILFKRERIQTSLFSAERRSISARSFAISLTSSCRSSCSTRFSDRYLVRER